MAGDPGASPGPTVGHGGELGVGGLSQENLWGKTEVSSRPDGAPSLGWCPYIWPPCQHSTQYPANVPEGPAKCCLCTPSSQPLTWGGTTFPCLLNIPLAHKLQALETTTCPHLPTPSLESVISPLAKRQQPVAWAAGTRVVREPGWNVAGSLLERGNWVLSVHQCQLES